MLLFGEQLSLFEGELALSRIPWEGRSPRALTRVGLSPIFKAQAEKSVSDFVSADQLELELTGSEGPRVYAGAPLLVPLLRREIR